MRYGYFDNARREYVIERPDVPVSWTNYLGVRDMCTVISHNAGGYSFYKSAEHGRVTRFRPNGVPLDRPGHYVYVRDDDTGEYWTISWQPVGLDLAQAKYEVRHGLSYSKFSCDHAGIHAEQTLFIPVEDDVELWDVRLRNDGDRPRRLSLFSYVEFSFGHVDIDNQNFQMSLYASGTSCRDGIIEFDFFYEPWTYRFFAGDFQPDSYDCVRDAFIGPYRTETNPIAVERGVCGGSAELGGNGCGSLHKRVSLQPGEEARVLFMLGVGSRAEAGYAMQRKYAQPGAVDRAFVGTERVLAAQDRCPPGADPARGAGHDDQHLDPLPGRDVRGLVALRLVRRSRRADGAGLPRHLAGRDGRAAHPPGEGQAADGRAAERPGEHRVTACTCSTPNGSSRRSSGCPASSCRRSSRRRAKISSSTAWPTSAPMTTCGSSRRSASTSRRPATSHVSTKSSPLPTRARPPSTSISKRSLDFSAGQIGANGICLGLRADWNDCLNLGGGESAMAHFIFHWALLAFVEAARYLGREDDVAKYTAIAEQIAAAAESQLWDGAWYLRGFTRTGRKIGTHEGEEGKIHLNGQSWAVMSGVASRERGRRVHGLGGPAPLLAVRHPPVLAELHGAGR